MTDINIIQLKEKAINVDLGIEINQPELFPLAKEHIGHSTMTATINKKTIQDASCKQVFDILKEELNPQLTLFPNQDKKVWVEKLKKNQDINIGVEKEDLDTMISIALIKNYKKLINMSYENLITLSNIVTLAGIKDTKNQYTLELNQLRQKYPKISFTEILHAASQILKTNISLDEKIDKIRKCICREMSEEEIKFFAENKKLDREKAESEIQTINNLIPKIFSVIESEKGFASQYGYKNLKSQYVLAYNPLIKKFTFGKNSEIEEQNLTIQNQKKFTDFLNMLESGRGGHIEEYNFIISKEKSIIPLSYIMMLCTVLLKPESIKNIKNEISLYIKKKIFDSIFEEYNEICDKIKSINLILKEELEKNTKDSFQQEKETLLHKKDILNEIIGLNYNIIGDYSFNFDQKNKNLSEKIVKNIIYTSSEEMENLYKNELLIKKIKGLNTNYSSKLSNLIYTYELLKKFEETFSLNKKEKIKEDIIFKEHKIYLAEIEKIDFNLGIFIKIKNEQGDFTTGLISKYKINQYEKEAPYIAIGKKCFVKFIKNEEKNNEGKFDFKPPQDKNFNSLFSSKALQD